MEKLYDIKLDKEKCILYVNVNGKFEVDHSKLYISDFQTHVNTINPSVYTLIMDVNGQEAVDEEIIVDMVHVLNLYSSAKFRKTIAVQANCQLAQQQIEQVVMETKFAVTFVKTLKEAYNLINEQ
ncbi:hypothetical protein J2Z40_003259 [Cytobacillus eiseniae]|uniref:STAS domain-containing protein n=1 Tax=Cytobacillus eiseniae TaxID=762947 RepID=A0ABS4RIE7_9BACI|nr:hypothetical protein [Cytobacillus eiseniae]MBP2242679.1 hypothetical protein [Cytobacillus eiseniae]